MGIYISDLEIPKDKAVQIVIIRDDGICVDEWGNTYGVVSLPSHGRLIDADALEQDAQKRLLVCNKYDDQFQKLYEVMRAIALAPTIIPAEPCNDLVKPNIGADYPPSIPLKQVWAEVFGEECE